MKLVFTGLLLASMSSNLLGASQQETFEAVCNTSKTVFGDASAAKPYPLYFFIIEQDITTADGLKAKVRPMPGSNSTYTNISCNEENFTITTNNFENYTNLKNIEGRGYTIEHFAFVIEIKYVINVDGTISTVKSMNSKDGTIRITTPTTIFDHENKIIDERIETDSRLDDNKCRIKDSSGVEKLYHCTSLMSSTYKFNTDSKTTTVNRSKKGVIFDDAGNELPDLGWEWTFLIQSSDLQITIPNFLNLLR